MGRTAAAHPRQEPRLPWTAARPASRLRPPDPGVGAAPEARRPPAAEIGATQDLGLRDRLSAADGLDVGPTLPDDNKLPARGDGKTPRRKVLRQPTSVAAAGSAVIF